MKKEEIRVKNKGIRDILEALLSCKGYGETLTPLSVRRLSDYIHDLEEKTGDGK